MELLALKPLLELPLLELLLPDAAELCAGSKLGSGTKRTNDTETLLSGSFSRETLSETESKPGCSDCSELTSYCHSGLPSTAPPPADMSITPAAISAMVVSAIMLASLRSCTSVALRKPRLNKCPTATMETPKIESDNITSKRDKPAREVPLVDCIRIIWLLILDRCC